MREESSTELTLLLHSTSLDSIDRSIFLTHSQSGFKTHLPVIVIDTNCQEVKDEPKIRTEFCTCR